MKRAETCTHKMQLYSGVDPWKTFDNG